MMNSRVFLLILVLFTVVVLSQAWIWGRRRRRSSRSASWWNRGSPKPSNRGVTAAKLAAKASDQVDLTTWSLAGCKGGSRFCGKNKCNLFVYDMLVRANAKVPKRSSWYYSPIGANEWGNPSSSYVRGTGCYYRVYRKQKGDIIAFPNPGGLGHVGIVYSNSEYISAKEKKIEKTGYPDGRTYVLWRYRYGNSNC